MLGARAEWKAGGAFLASLLVHGAMIAGLASFPALHSGPPRPEPTPILLALLPAPAPEPTPSPAAPIPDAASVPEAAPEPIIVPPPPLEIPAPPPPEPVRVAAAPLPPAVPLAPAPDALPRLDPPPPVAKAPPKPKPVKKAPAPVVAPASPVADISTSILNTLTSTPPVNPAPATPTPPAPEIAAVPLITEPRFREQPVKPAYPPRAAALDQQGEALVRVRVGPEGDQEEVLLWRSSGFELLDRAALATVRRWQFEPYRRDGIAFAAWVQVPIRFTLN